MQAKDGAGLNGGEADGAAAEERVAVEVAGSAEEIVRIDEGAGERDAEAFGGLHAEGLPEIAVEDDGRLDIKGFHAGHGHLPAGAGELGSDDGALDEGGAGSEGLVPGEAEPGALGIEAEKLWRAGIPDAEDAAGEGIVRGALDLGRTAEAGDEEKGVDVALVKAAEGEVSAADEGKHAKQREVLTGIGAEAEAALGAWEGGRREGRDLRAAGARLRGRARWRGGRRDRRRSAGRWRLDRREADAARR